MNTADKAIMTLMIEAPITAMIESASIRAGKAITASITLCEARSTAPPK